MMGTKQSKKSKPGLAGSGPATNGHVDKVARSAAQASREVADAAARVDFEHASRQYDIYLDDRRFLSEGERSLDRAITTTVLTISGGGLAISLTIVKEYGTALSQWSGLLGCAWSMLVLAILSSLLVLKLDQQAHSRFRAILDSECLAGLEGATERARSRQYSCVLRRILIVADWVSVVLCVAGTALLFVFGYLMISNGVQKHAGEADPATKASTDAALSPASTKA